VTPVTSIYSPISDPVINVTPITATISGTTDLTYKSAYDSTQTVGITINGDSLEEELNPLSSLTSEESGRAKIIFDKETGRIVDE
jgi:hypothetical protein